MIHYINGVPTKNIRMKPRRRLTLKEQVQRAKYAKRDARLVKII